MIEAIKEPPVRENSDQQLLTHQLQIVEFRYTPLPVFLDQRGEMTGKLEKELQLSRWQTGKDLIRVFNPEETIRCQVGYRNSIVTLLDQTTAKLNTMARHVARVLCQSQALSGTQLPIKQIGCRQQKAIPYDGAFETLRKNIQTRYCGLKPEAQRVIAEAAGDSVSLADLSSVNEFDTTDGQVRAIVGPMHAHEVERALEVKDELPEVSLWIDIDVLHFPSATLGTTEIGERCASATATMESVANRVAKLILEEPGATEEKI